MSEQFVTFTKEDTEEGRIGRIMLDRPPANSYDMAFVQQLGAAIDAAELDDDVYVIVVQSSSEKFFSAGADIKAFAANTTADNMTMIRRAHVELEKMAESDKIYIAAINGHTLGGGLEIALACDLRFAKEGKYYLGLPEVTLGIFPGNGGTQRLPRLIGRNKALELMITGERIDPQTALALGIVNKLFSVESFADEVTAYASRLAAGASIAVGAIKRAVYDGMEIDISEGLELEQELMALLFDTNDAAEGFAAFVEKRAPNFKGM